MKMWLSVLFKIREMQNYFVFVWFLQEKSRRNRLFVRQPLLGQLAPTSPHITQKNEVAPL